MNTEKNQKKLNLLVITNVFQACGFIEGFIEIPDHVDTEQATKQAWQFLIDTGHAWTLQGFYGRTANHLIKCGYCSPPPK